MRPFAEESRIWSWWYVISTFTLLGALLVMAALSTVWPLRVGASLTGGLLLVRAFILFHDFLHGSLLRGSRLAWIIFYVYGMAMLTPPRNWRHSHNYHHANVGKLLNSDGRGVALLTTDIGAFPLMTTDEWRHASALKRTIYRIARHPLTILFAYLTVFLGSLCVGPLLANPRKNWEGILSLAAHGGIGVALWYFGGWPTLAFAFLLPVAMATALGAYLFFAQHNFKGMRVVPNREWTFYRGALESSSYLKLGPVMRWFTGNIGYHHVHHLNSHIPFYRLPEAMSAIPELQRPQVTTLFPRDVVACLRLSLWDPQREELVSFREAIAPSS